MRWNRATIFAARTARRLRLRCSTQRRAMATRNYRLNAAAFKMGRRRAWKTYSLTLLSLWRYLPLRPYARPGNRLASRRTYRLISDIALSTRNICHLNAILLPLFAPSIGYCTYDARAVVFFVTFRRYSWVGTSSPLGYAAHFTTVHCTRADLRTILCRDKHAPSTGAPAFAGLTAIPLFGILL